MRITNQMLARTSEKTGIPLQRNSLLNIRKEKSSHTDLFSSLRKLERRQTILSKENDEKDEMLQTEPKSFKEYVEKLYANNMLEMNGYGADGMELYRAFTEGMYDFWG